MGMDGGGEDGETGERCRDAWSAIDFVEREREREWDSL